MCASDVFRKRTRMPVVVTRRGHRGGACPRTDGGIEPAPSGPGRLGVMVRALLVAAHRTLPLGSVIRVTNLENGRRVTLRVIDRGPYGRNFRKGTIVDVSRGAARRLRMVRDGLVKVRIEVMKLGDR